MIRPIMCCALALHCAFAVPPRIRATTSPQTEDPETIGSGRILIEAGLDYNRDVYYPLSGLRGNLFACRRWASAWA